MLSAAALASLTTSVWPFVIVPAALVKAPPAIEYSPPVMLIGDAVLIPETVTAVELIVAFRAAPVTAVKLNALGVVSGNSVVTLKVCATPPTVKVACVVAPKVAAVARLTTTVWPLVTVPAALVKVPPFIEYPPLAMLMGAAVLMPEMVIAADVTFAFNAAPVTAVRLNESGVVSIGTTITLLVELREELPSEPILEPPWELLTELPLEEFPSELTLELVSELVSGILLEELLSALLLELLTGLELGGTGSGFLPPPPPPPQAANELTRPRIKSLRIPV